MRAARKPFGLAQASRRWWTVLLILVGASLFAYRTRHPVVLEAARFGGPAQGTTYSVVLGGARSPAVVAALKATVDSLLADVDAKLSTYDPQSELMRFNQHRDTTPVPISEHFAEVMRVSLAVSQASGGAFDVTVAPLVNAWGFGPGGRTGHTPHDTTLAALRDRVGWEKLRLRDRTLAKSNPLLEIDLSADAPGYTVDLISALLVARGEANHFIEVGGEVRARGKNAAGQPFRVGIEEPIPDERRIRLAVALADRALATSGNYRDFQDIDGVRYTHILDPSVGKPVRHGLLSVSVLHERCAYADAWATALFVVGPERAWELANANGLEVLLLTAGPKGEVQERMTDGFRAIVLRDSVAGAIDHTTRRGKGPTAKVP